MATSAEDHAPVIGKFLGDHWLPYVTVLADAGVISEANQKAIGAARLSFIRGMKIPEVPYQMGQVAQGPSREEIPMGTSSPGSGLPANVRVP